MRLLRLDLLRYGHLTDTRLDFPEAAPLVVVLGPNEAGKSTTLSAIGDALWGFPLRSPHAFLHETSALRLGFEVLGHDGSRAAFLRRKGNRNTLLDMAENPVPEAALLRLLGGASRGLFETTYGLNGATLRDGALSLLASGGEAGESLLAGMGLPHLRKALERLDAEAKALHGDGRGRRALAAAADAWAEQRRAAEEAAIRPREWQATKAEYDTLCTAIEEATAQGDALAAEAALLNRARRILPLLASLDALRQDAEALADAPSLPAEAAATLRRLLEDHRLAAEDRRREAAEAQALEAEAAALPQDPAVLAEQDAIDLLAEQRAGALDAARDLPGVQRKVEAYRAEVEEAAALLGSGATAEALRESLPRAADRQAAQALIRQRTERATALASAQSALAEATRQREAAEARLGACPTPPATAPLRRAIDAARGEGPLDRELAAAERALAEASRQVSTALAALPLWCGDAAGLAALKLPLPPACDAAARRLAEATADITAARQAEAALAEEIAALAEAMQDLARGEKVPTAALIAAARARRDAAWAELREHLDAGSAADPALPDRFEAQRDEADRLADARADDAARVNDYAAKGARLDLLRARQPLARETSLRAEAAEAAAVSAWAALWQPAGLVPQDAATMAEWRRGRAEVLRLAEQEAAARRQRDALAERRATALATLHTVLPAADTRMATLTPLLDRAQDQLDATEAAQQRHRDLTKAATDAAERQAAARQAQAGAAAALADFAPQWRAATQALGLPADASAEAVERALGAWTRVAEAAKAWRGDAARVADMAQAIARFAQDTGAVLDRLGLPPGEDPAPAWVARLGRRLEAARQAAKDDATLAKRLQQRRQEAAAAGARLAEAERRIGALQALAGTDSLPALEEAIRRAAARTERRAAIAGAEAALRAQGDGHAEAALRAEAEGTDPDQATARLHRIEAEQAALRERLTTLGAQRQDAEARLAAMQRGRDAAAHAQQARHHLAEAGAAAERFARLHLARTLLQAGIERIRQERQGPLLRRAGAHFALLTHGRYTRLATDEDEAGRTLLRAVRDDRTECPVEALSEGTRDQLFLALRVAAVEAQAAAAEPLPFIADDLLASFDDARATAALALLARLGATTQTILFTHHAHLADLAARQPGVVVREMPGFQAPRFQAPRFQAEAHTA
ncbi:AAA family ATPase [Falsiroseomonas selenitidurans]|uniref:AAA family ATPase n=1 Tax=Falsiroseomonas selenitidurans TaxID=2716335 RepID=A0ABX1E3S2_9PROT|nr:AAA family ATPase [Falsiroseomonas selenitidurans]NKC31832.1 AAA family ATPase [Falsiroseomonas selenitidurans]